MSTKPGQLQSSQRVLDVGAADGFIAIELARLGASEVVALEPWKKALRRMEFASQHLGLSTIRPLEGSVYDIDSSLGEFDVIFMLAVLYHLENPVLALRRVASLSDLLYAESITVDDEDHSYLYLRDPSESSSHFVPKWLPTKKCLKDILEWVGYTEIEEVGSLDEGRSIYVARK